MDNQFDGLLRRGTLRVNNSTADIIRISNHKSNFGCPFRSHISLDGLLGGSRPEKAVETTYL